MLLSNAIQKRYANDPDLLATLEKSFVEYLSETKELAEVNRLFTLTPNRLGNYIGSITRQDNSESHRQLLERFARDYAAATFARDGQHYAANENEWSATIFRGLTRKQNKGITFDPGNLAANFYKPSARGALPGLHINPGNINILNGYSNTGKSFFLYGLIAAVATGTPFLGHETRQGTCVLLSRDVEKERAAGEISRILGHIAKTHRLPANLSELIVVDDPGFYLEDPEAPEIISRYMRGATLFCMDSLRTYLEGDEVDARNRKYADLISAESAKAECAALIAMHAPKASEGRTSEFSVRGSGAWVDCANTLLGIERAEIPATRELAADYVYTVQVHKTRNARKPKPVAYRLVDSGNVFDPDAGKTEFLALEVTSDTATTDVAILAALAEAPGETLNQSQLTTFVNGDKNRKKARLEEVERRGFIRSEKKGEAKNATVLYTLTEAGKVEHTRLTAVRFEELA